MYTQSYKWKFFVHFDPFENIFSIKWGWMATSFSDKNTEIYAKIKASSLEENGIKTETSHVMTKYALFQRPL